jgi:hypothetical protein
METLLRQLLLSDEFIDKLALAIAKKQKELKPARKPKHENTEAVRLADFFERVYESHGLGGYVKQDAGWVKAFRLMLEVDKLESSDIVAVIRFAAVQTKLHLEGQVAFRVQSPASLRKKFADLKMGASRAEAPNASSPYGQVKAYV